MAGTDGGLTITAWLTVPEQSSLESGALAARAVLAEVNAFLTEEVHLLDDREYGRWLEMFTAECLYWMPVDPLAVDGALRLNVFYDNRARLEDRIARLTSGGALTEDPPTLTSRLVSAVQAAPIPDAGADSLLVRSNFVLTAHRRGEQRQFGGRYLHRLVRQDRALRIAEKRVTLLGSDAPQRPMTFPF